MDPVAMAFGPDGRLWVVEMGDYPRGADGKGGHGGRVRVLEDRDGDGHYDRSTVFLDDLGFPNGVMPWRNGASGHAAPGHSLRRRHRRRRPGRQARGAVSRLSGRQSAASRQRAEVGTRRLALLRAWRCEGRQDRAAQAGRGKTAAANGRDFRIRPDEGLLDPAVGHVAVWPQPRRLGQLVRQLEQQPDVPVRAGRPLSAAQPARAGGQRPRAMFRSSRAWPKCFRQPHDRPLQRSVRRQPLHLGQQHDRLSRRAVRPGVRGQRVRQRAGAQPGASRNHAARRAGVPQPPRRRRTGRASFWPRPTTGSARPCWPTGPTARCGSPTCIARRSSIRSGFRRKCRSRSTLRAGSDMGRIYRVYPVGNEAAQDSAARQAVDRRAGRRARQPERSGSATWCSSCSCGATTRARPCHC